ncbi:MAG TPA: condensation domain-containing protein, partial [Chloroflexota bacterium]|nr:condensation domain-containing protein [Chloroflexota bacterium]
MELRTSGHLDPACFNASFEYIFLRQPYLRGRFACDGGAAYWVEREASTAEVQWVPSEGWDPRRLERQIDVGNGPLLACEVVRHRGLDVVRLCIDHVVFDGGSVVPLIQQLGVGYGRPSTPVQPHWDYAAYAQDHASKLDVQRHELWRYWRRLYEDVGGPYPVVRLPGLRPSLKGASEGTTCVVDMAAPQGNEVLRFFTSQRLTPFMGFLACLGMATVELGGAQSFAVLSSSSGRWTAGIRDVIGYFSNVILISVGRAPADDPLAWMDGTRNAVVGALKHAFYPRSWVLERMAPEFLEEVPSQPYLYYAGAPATPGGWRLGDTEVGAPTGGDSFVEKRLYPGVTLST